MLYNPTPVSLHPQVLTILFAFRPQVSQVFKEVLGMHAIDHLALTRINAKQELTALSSTPALEFNLFKGPLWRYDRSYDPSWYRLGTQDSWQHLYQPTRYDELYYLKQIRHALPLGLTLAAQVGENYFVYSLASHSSCRYTKERFAASGEDFYKIGQHCALLLDPLFQTCDELGEETTPEVPFFI